VSVLSGLGLAWKLKKVLLIGLGVGVATIVATSVSSHSFAAVISGIGAAISVVAVQARLAVRRPVPLPTR